MEKLRKIAETLVNLTILETKELSRILEDEHGIKPSVKQTHLGFVDNIEKEPEVQTEFDVEIVSIESASKLSVIKLVKELTSMGLRESKELVDSTPFKIRENVSESEANEIKNQFESIGVNIEIK